MRKKNPPKNPSAFITHVKGSAEMRREVQRLRNSDYDVLLPGTHIRRNGTEKSWSDLISSQLRSGAMEDGSKQLREVPTLYASAGNEQLAGTENIGTPSLGYIEWGQSLAQLRLPAYPHATLHRRWHRVQHQHGCRSRSSTYVRPHSVCRWQHHHQTDTLQGRGCMATRTNHRPPPRTLQSL